MSAGDGRFEPERLLAPLRALPGSGRLVVAFSGGLDSTALVLALAALIEDLGRPVSALHVNHGVHPRAARWQEHCRRFCAALGLPIVEHVVESSAAGTGGRSEAELRAQRYAAFERVLDAGDVLLTAHHREDQSETVLLHLLRGSGVDGLRGMPSLRPLGKGFLARPLLPWPRRALAEYVERCGQSWIEDPDNDNLSRDRNFLRHEVLPKLRQRWPQADRALNRSASFAGELSILARTLLRDRLAERVRHGVLPLEALPEREPAALRAFLREWVRAEGASPIPVARLEEFCRQVLAADGDTVPTLVWDGRALRRHDDRLWFGSAETRFAPIDRPWDGRSPVTLGEGLGSLRLKPATDGALPQDCRVALRRGGERFRVAPGEKSRALKDLLREARIPPWLRDGIPLLISGGELIAVGDWLLSEPLRERLSACGARLRWTPREPALVRCREDCHASP